MKCPSDGETLVMTERQGVEIDYCPKCRGVWLDRGELEKILERSGALPGGPRREPRPHDFPPYPHHGHKRRRSFLDELFDFD